MVSEFGYVIAQQFQYRKRYELHAMRQFRKGLLFMKKFQYRKRYELHAMP